MRCESAERSNSPALGNLFAGWVNELLDEEELEDVSVTLAPTEDGVQIGLTLPSDSAIEDKQRLIARLRPDLRRPRRRRPP